MSFISLGRLIYIFTLFDAIMLCNEVFKGLDLKVGFQAPSWCLHVPVS